MPAQWEWHAFQFRAATKDARPLAREADLNGNIYKVAGAPAALSPMKQDFLGGVGVGRIELIPSPGKQDFLDGIGANPI